MEKTFSGDLSRVEVPDLLTFINMGRRTGVLQLVSSGQQTGLYFSAGDPVFATTNTERLRLGEILLRMGKLTAQQLAACVEKHRATGHRLGQVLVEDKLLSAEELTSLLKVQVSELFFDVFRWRLGQFDFYDDMAPPAGAVMLQMNLQNLIMEGVRRLDERGRIGQVFSNLDAVVESVANPDHVKDKVTLTGDEWSVYFLVDGRRSLRDICQLAGQPDDLATLEVLYRLLEANLIQLSSLPPAAPVEDEVPTLAAASAQSAASAQAGASAPVSVRSGSPRPASPDDSGQIVNAKAVQYASAARGAEVVAYLVFETPNAGGRRSFPLLRDSHAIGRAAQNDLVIEDGKVSSFHARVDRIGAVHHLVDLKSTNGTLLNGRRISRGPLTNGDEFRLGVVLLRYVKGDVPPA